MIKGMCEHDFQLLSEDYWIRMKELGVKIVRVDFSWWYIQRDSPTQWDWMRCDAIVALAKKYDIQILALLGTSPKWANGGHPQGKETGYWFCPCSIGYSYSRYVIELVDRYAHYIKHYEVWNEPNSKGFWSNSKIDGDDASGYMAMLKQTFEIIKTFDASLQVVSAGLVDFGFKRVKNWFPIGTSLVNQLGYIHDMYSQGLKDYCDIFAIHPYFGDTNPKDKRWYMSNGLPARWNWEDGMKAVRKVMELNGDTKPIWVTETGWQTNSKVSEQKQSDYLKLIYETKLPYIQAVFWYELFDTGDKPTDWTYGIVKSNGQPKLAYNTYRGLK